MAEEQREQARRIANELLDRVKRDHGLRSERELARFFKTRPMNILRWRDGQLPLAFIVLAPHLLANASEIRAKVA